MKRMAMILVLVIVVATAALGARALATSHPHLTGAIHGGDPNSARFHDLAGFNAHPVRFLRTHPGQLRYYQRYLRRLGYHTDQLGTLGPRTVRAAQQYAR